MGFNLAGLATAFALLFATSAAAAPIATVPYSINEEGSITVNVTIDGRGPYVFIVDTGATVTLAFQNLAARERFTPTGGEPKRVLGITGSAVLDTYRFGDVALGGAVIDDHVGVVLPDWAAPRITPDGILGIDFFRRYAVVFDINARTMSLYPHGGLPADVLRWRRVKLAPKSYAAVSGELFTALAKLNGEPATFIIDLGSVSSLVNYKAGEAIFSNIITSSGARSRTTGTRLADVFDDRTKTRVGRFGTIRAGQLVWRNRLVWLKDAPIFKELGVERQPFGLLGLDLLAEKSFALDFGENRLYVSR